MIVGLTRSEWLPETFGVKLTQLGDLYIAAFPACEMSPLLWWSSTQSLIVSSTLKQVLLVKSSMSHEGRAYVALTAILCFPIGPCYSFHH